MIVIKKKIITNKKKVIDKKYLKLLELYCYCMIGYKSVLFKPFQILMSVRMDSVRPSVRTVLVDLSVDVQRDLQNTGASVLVCLIYYQFRIV